MSDRNEPEHIDTRAIDLPCPPDVDTIKSDVELRNLVFALRSGLGDDPRLQRAAARWAERRGLDGNE